MLKSRKNIKDEINMFELFHVDKVLILKKDLFVNKKKFKKNSLKISFHRKIISIYTLYIGV